MKIDRKFYFKAHNFVADQLDPTSNVFCLPVSYGHTNFRAPGMYVSVPLNEIDDHTASVFALFHEFGHWLEMKIWISENRKDPSGDARLDAIAFNDYQYEIGVLQSPGKLEVKEAVLESERKARKYGREGLLIDGDYYHGMSVFDAQYSEPKGKLIEGYESYSEKMYSTYLKKWALS